ncbi:hypothetical protein ACFE04_009901 [Oxalis oulophora]
MSRNGEGGKLACVTGASGYIASWLVNFLLQRGYTVRATVRHPNDPKKTEHLRGLEGAKERLHLFKAELLEEGIFDSIIDGCQAVFHTASPVAVSVNDPQLDLIDPAVNGTLNVLRSCAKTSSVKRVVITSSMAAVTFNGRPLDPDVVVDETWFSDPTFCKESKGWYMLSKTLAEEAAWKFAKENGIDLVTIHPGFVIGPMLHPTLHMTAEMFVNIINGSGTSYEHYRFVDVRDVAYAHILAFEVPSANGRYILVRSIIHSSDLENTLREHYPTLKIAKCAEGSGFFPTMYQVTREKAERLGVVFTPLEVTLKDTVESLKEKGFLNCLSASTDRARMSSGGGGGEEKVVCVTGASGYIASWLVKFLLQRGYTVRATVRDPSDPTKTEHLCGIQGAKERLRLFKAELLEEGVFDSIIDGCQAVFHTASPVILSSVNDPQRELIDPAVNGTLNVLKSCAKTSSVKRVVVTSSIAAVMHNTRRLEPDVIVDETWFSDPTFWYILAKTLAEEAAWKAAKENGLDLVTIHPGLVIGPMLQPAVNGTAVTRPELSAINSLAVSGAEYLNRHWLFVDVRDVAHAHILALEVPSANGRYILTSTVIHASNLVKMVREQYPTLKLPEKCSDDSNGFFQVKFQVTREKAERLGVNFTPLEVTLKDTVENLKEKGFLNV